jgi:RAB protein geranylgeranyltransferase component A
MTVEKFYFDQTHFDCFVFGTDLTESILAAVTATKGKSVISLEFEG